MRKGLPSIELIKDIPFYKTGAVFSDPKQLGGHVYAPDNKYYFNAYERDKLIQEGWAIEIKE